MINLFNDAANIRVLLLTEFYSRPEILEELCNIIRCNTECSTKIISNNNIQIQLKKSFLKRLNISIQNSSAFYTTFNAIIYQLIDSHKDELVQILASRYEDPETIFLEIRQYINMLYSMTILSSNTIMLYL